MDGISNMVASSSIFQPLPASNVKPTNQPKSAGDPENTRVEMNYQKELGQVVVKVIDVNSDTVIKELPSTVVQEMHRRLRETLGKLIDITI
jgi:uncharacterized FlaG/YvyC family protein